jgi:predicted TIM-barrel fold metal-dependent hydrolase
VEIKNMVKALKSLPLTEHCIEKILRTNGERLLGGQSKPAH